MKKLLFFILLFTPLILFASHRNLNLLHPDTAPTYSAVCPEPTDNYKSIDFTTKPGALVLSKYLETLEVDSATYAAAINKAIQKLPCQTQLELGYRVLRPLLVKENTKEDYVDNNGNQIKCYKIKRLTPDQLTTVCHLSALTNASAKANSNPDVAQYIQPEQEESAQPEHITTVKKKRCTCTVL